jgi:hypothetical protein
MHIYSKKTREQYIFALYYPFPQKVTTIWLLKATLQILAVQPVPTDKFYYEILTKLVSSVAELF